MEQNRRRFLRKVPNDLAFIQIERDEVGKVLNVSEGGLSFSSVTPVPRNLPVYFWFSFNLKDRIEAMGEVAWTDLSRTVGGLRFTQLSQGSREQIQKWLSRLRTEEIPRQLPDEVEVADEEEIPEEEEALVPQLVPAASTANLPVRANEPIPKPISIKTRERKAGEPDRVARFVSKARGHRPILSLERKTAEDAKGAQAAALAIAPPPPLTLESEPELQVEPPKTRPSRAMFSLETGATQGPEPGDSKVSSLSFRGIESLVELVPLQRYLSAKKRQLLCGVILGICMSALVMLLVLKFWNYRIHAAPLKSAVTDSSGLRDNVPSQPPATSAAALPAVKPNYPVAGVFSDPAPISFKNRKATTPSLIAKNQAVDPYWDKPRTVAAKGSKQSSGASAQSSSTTASPGNKKSGMTPNELWGQVQAGNSKAAVELAELYIKGDGVPQNCKQARVLLLVASEKRNTAAIKRLQQLDRGAACP
jgi:PilZ domain